MTTIRCSKCGHTMIDFSNNYYNVAVEYHYTFIDDEINVERFLVCRNCGNKTEFSKVKELLVRINKWEELKERMEVI